MKKIAYGLLMVLCLAGLSFAEGPTHGWKYLSKTPCHYLYLAGTQEALIEAAGLGGPKHVDLKTYSKTRATELLAKYSIRHPGAVEEGAYCFEGGYIDELPRIEKKSDVPIAKVFETSEFYERFWQLPQ